MIKKLLLITLAFLLWAAAFTFGQSIAATKATAGWNPVYAGSTIVVSNKSGFNYPAQPGVYPWHSAPMPPPASLSLTYLTLQAEGSMHNGDGGMTTTITGLTPGFEYTIKYSLMASLYYYNGGTTTTQWPTLAGGQVNNGVSIVKPDIAFSPGVNTNKWIQQSITFKAQQTTASFSVIVKVPTNAKGVVSLDMISDPIDETTCNFSATPQVDLTSTFLTNACPAQKINLNTAFTGTPPQGSSLVWFSNPQHTGWSVIDPTNVTVSGSYYAFFYDSVGDCYNTDNSTRMVQASITGCCSAGTAQVSLTSNFLTNICPAKKINLNSAFTGTSPTGSSLVWFDNPQHTGTKIADPTNITTSGFYYAFFYDSVNNCYNTANSSAMVQSFIKDCCKTGTAQVPLTATTLKNICPSQLVDLRTLMNGLPPDGTDIVFYSTANHAPGTLISGSEIGGIKKINVGVSGTYYAFFYDAVNDCFNTANSTSAVVVTITPCPPPCNAGTAQVVVNASLKNVCPATTVNLNDAGPAFGKAITWCTDAAHANIYSNPTTATAGTYYAFYYDAVNDCWNTNNSTAKVVVTISVCPPPCNVGTDQVLLKSSVASNLCPSKTVDLNQTVTSNWADGALNWYDNPTHSGNPIDPAFAVGAGTYYAFITSGPDCWNTDNSTAKVTVTITRCDPSPCRAGAAAPSLSATTLSNVCPSSTVDLTSLVNSIAPAGTTVKWYTSSIHQPGTEVANPSSVSASGVYFAFYYDAVNNCWSSDHPASVNVTIVLCCKAGTAQVILSGETNFQQNCPSSTFNLNNTFTGSAPVGTSLVWFTDALHAAPVADPTAVKAGFYYAFFYDAVNQCYNTDISDAKVYVTAPPQVGLSATTSSLCPPATINLNTLFQGFQPVGSVIRWFDNATHSGAQIADPSKAGLGTYYAFFYFGPENCYNTDNSTSKVIVSSNCVATCNAGSEQVIVINPAIQLLCPGQTVDLKNSILVTQLPAGVEFVWFDNPQHNGSPIAPTTSVSVGTYYCFLFDVINNCYNTNNSTAVLAILPAQQVKLKGNSLENVCPKLGFDTDDLFGLLVNDNDGELRWFDNPTHTGSWIQPGELVGAGEYYAFEYFVSMDCYNTENSTAKVTATVIPCAPSAIAIKIALQGAMPGSGTTMRNDLQKYTNQTIVGVLPKTDPYGNGVVYNDINNPAGVAGNVVDWVKVDIKSAVSPFAVLQTKSLLLRTDGYLVDVNGQYPSFTQPSGDVFIVVKHRNHLAIRSNPINLIAGSADFTTGLNTVFNDGSSPDQMKLVNGIWCMISGDVSQDYFVSNQDVTQTRNGFKTGGVGVYSSRDLNMNAFLENQDVTAQRNRFNAGFFSIVFKY
ncbi:MAG: hypothetical protein ABIN80_16685 [Dyadobacter sp.]|uniref:hypothetical protein n=1 Tax=Dyadobacter sp. TaxID=1914288 RepID=UPI003267314A